MRIAIVAGEASGDLLASHLIKALQVHFPDAQLFGVGGPKMQASGFKSWYSMEMLAVRGYIEVLRHYRKITRMRRELLQRLCDTPPDLFIGVDAPDFNLWLERALRQKGIRTVHYVGPSIWAWRGKRIRKIAEAVDRMLVLFPFEPPLYEAANIPVSYVGHPLADVIPDSIDVLGTRAQLKLPLDAKVIALLPGSRQSELQYMAATYVQTARLIHAQLPDVLFLVPLTTRETRTQFEQALFDHGGGDLPVTIMFGHAQDALAAADVALVASGTATLEAALIKTPMLITYKMAPLSWKMMQRMKYQPYVGLPNILCGEFIVPEILQDDATPENLAQALLNLLRDTTAQECIRMRFSELHATLRQDTSARAVAAILPLLPQRAVA